MTLRQRWDAWAADNLDRCPHETGVEAAKRRAGGFEPEVTSVTVAHLRPGVLVLAVYGGRFWPTFAVIDHRNTLDTRWWIVAGKTVRPICGGANYSDHELWLVPLSAVHDLEIEEVPTAI